MKTIKERKMLANANARPYSFNTQGCRELAANSTGMDLAAKSTVDTWPHLPGSHYADTLQQYWAGGTGHDRMEHKQASILTVPSVPSYKICQQKGSWNQIFLPDPWRFSEDQLPILLKIKSTEPLDPCFELVTGLSCPPGLLPGCWQDLPSRVQRAKRPEPLFSLEPVSAKENYWQNWCHFVNIVPSLSWIKKIQTKLIHAASFPCPAVCRTAVTNVTN